MTILLVDDEPLQALTRKAILERRFPDVERVAGGVDALCLMGQPEYSKRLGLLVSGHHLPGLTGPAFVSEVRCRMPQLPILVLGDSGEVASDYPGEGVRFLPRPISSEALLREAAIMVGLAEPVRA
jgi:CheY-like chemotaxis protein